MMLSFQSTLAIFQRICSKTNLGRTQLSSFAEKTGTFLTNYCYLRLQIPLPWGTTVVLPPKNCWISPTQIIADVYKKIQEYDQWVGWRTEIALLDWWIQQRRAEVPTRSCWTSPRNLCLVAVWVSDHLISSNWDRGLEAAWSPYQSAMFRWVDCLRCSWIRHLKRHRRTTVEAYQLYLHSRYRDW